MYNPNDLLSQGSYRLVAKTKSFIIKIPKLAIARVVKMASLLMNEET